MTGKYNMLAALWSQECRRVSGTLSKAAYRGGMPTTDPDSRAELIESIHQPWKATLAECLQRWRGLDQLTRARSYLVIHEMTGIRRTLNATKIAALALDAGTGDGGASGKLLARTGA